MIRRRSTRSPISLRKMGCAASGVWALGMEGTDPAMVSALDGVAPAIAYATPAPPSDHDHVGSRPLRRRHPPRPRRVGASGQGGASTTGGAPVALHRAVHRRGVRGRVPGHRRKRHFVDACRSISHAERHAVCGGDTLRAQRKLRGTLFPWPVPRPRPLRGSARRFRERSWSALLRGLVVQNDSALSCLENANQSDELGSSSAVTTTPELVVWQWPGNQQYLYVVAATSPGSTSADCASATLAFPEPSATSASGLAAS